MHLSAIRNQFINFFKEKGHHYQTAVPLVNQTDPDLLFINAGMNPFKDIFLGNQSPTHQKVVSSQPCLRVTGKHNDLEEVGVDTYHHTLFEMLGNWSFGNYFKKQAIDWAWELLTQVYGIDPRRLYATVFEGDKKAHLAADHETYALWEKYLPKAHILYASKKENFWSMATTGPCGPSTEIHIDLRSKSKRESLPGRQLVNSHHPEVIELWNIVFMQYDQDPNSLLSPLPMKHVDTGMGLERLAMVLQNVSSTYETDAFKPLIQTLTQHTSIRYRENPTTDIALRVIADHIRAITFAIADGAIPSSQKEGYVVRRILRRALRYGYTHLQLKKPFLYQLTAQVVQMLGHAYPALKKQQDLIQTTLQQEEISFLKTLSQGLDKLHFIMEGLPKPSKQIPGQMVFELYDTYGFPSDLTDLIAREKGFCIDEKGFEQCMQAQKTRSKQNHALKPGSWHIIHPDLTSLFVGYDQLQTHARLIKYRMLQKKDTTHYQLILDRTPFYAEAGGQVGDIGYLMSGHQKIKVIDTQKENDLTIHYTTELPNDLTSQILCTVDSSHRANTSKNHTATHLMAAAMEKILGNHITQQGSLVHAKGLRFDFNHAEKINPADLQQIEKLVNEKIRANLSLEEKREISLQEAKNSGATATFGEKYGEKVRMVTYGDFCSDLCGGTHVQATGEIGFFKIKSERGTGKGIRRVEAVTGVEAEKWVQDQQATLIQIGEQLKNTQDPLRAAQQIAADYKKLQQSFERISRKILLQQAKQLEEKLQYLGSMYVCIEKVEVASPEDLKKLAFSLNKTKSPRLLVLATILEEKAYLLISISPEMTHRYAANEIIQKLLPAIQGKGGGKAHFALASGHHVTGIEKALKIAKSLLIKEKNL